MFAVIASTKRMTTKLVFCLILVLVVSLSSVTVFAEAQIFQDRAVQLLLQLNEARRDPLACAARLGINDDVVYAKFVGDSWILDRGLPPLAWNGLLADSTVAHGRDMFDRVYYDHLTPEGETVAQRVAGTGYHAAIVGETMNALFFVNNYIPAADALSLLVDAILRDELTGNPHVGLNIFSPDVTEVGVSFLAESIAELNNNPYVYLLILNFAQPVEPRYFIVGNVDSGNRLAMKNSYTGFWEALALTPGGLFQIPYPAGGATLTAYDSEGAIIATQRVYEANATHNHYLDLRGSTASH